MLYTLKLEIGYLRTVFPDSEPWNYVENMNSTLICKQGSGGSIQIFFTLEKTQNTI